MLILTQSCFLLVLFLNAIAINMLSFASEILLQQRMMTHWNVI